MQTTGKTAHTAKPKNVLVIMSDEHNPKFLSCAGHPFIKTPHLDALSQRGTRFTSAYTTSPICVPARAAFAAGRYVHEIGFWDNGDPYDGSVPSWHHVLREGGHEVVSIGKLHFRGQPGDDHGFTREQIPMHVIDGIGDIKGMVREDIPTRKGGDKMLRMAGPGESTYTHYDRDIVSQAQIWLQQHATPSDDAKPWVLFVSLVAPHFPLTAPPEWYYSYAAQDLPMPKLYAPAERPQHPFVKEYARVTDYDTAFKTEADVKRAIAGYSGLVSFLDEGIGKILKMLNQTGLEDDTVVIYTSDHGDNMGSRGLWGKSTMYEESAGVPLIMAGPGIEANKQVSTAVSHVDIAVTVLEAAGAPSLPEASGQSLFAIAAGAPVERTVVSEYHAIGSNAAATMIRVGNYKYCHYVGMPPQLFDLENDPEELNDVAQAPEYQAILKECQAKLLTILDPVAVDQRAKARQTSMLNKHGGREAAIAMGDLGFSPAPGTARDKD